MRVFSPAFAYVSLYACDFSKKSLKVLFKSFLFFLFFLGILNGLDWESGHGKETQTEHWQNRRSIQRTPNLVSRQANVTLINLSPQILHYCNILVIYCIGYPCGGKTEVSCLCYETYYGSCYVRYGVVGSRLFGSCVGNYGSHVVEHGQSVTSFRCPSVRYSPDQKV